MYNPYYIPYAVPTTYNTGFLSNLFGSSFSFSSIINGTSKALNIANQAIPLIKQASPILKNAKTMFKVMNEFKKDTDIKPVTEVSNHPNNIQEYQENDGPTFFM